MLDWLLQHYLLSAAGLLGLLWAVFTGLQFVVALCERAPVAAFVPLDVDEFPEPPPYANVMNQDALDTGFLDGGTARHVRHDVYATAWLSPDARAVGLVAWGRIARMKVRSTTLISRLGDGRWLVSKDDITGREAARNVNLQLLLHADWGELLAFHESRCDFEEAEALATHADEAWDVYQDYQTGRIDDLVEQGLGRYADPEQTAWRYTLAGARKTALRAKLAPAGSREELHARYKLRRPGDRGYVSRGLPTLDIDDDANAATIRESGGAPVSSPPSRAARPSMGIGIATSVGWIAGSIGAIVVGAHSPETIWPGVAILLATFGALVGLPLAIVGLVRSPGRPLSATLGLLLNSCVLLGSAAWVVLAVLFA